MTSTKTGKSSFRPALFFVIGLALSAFGVFHSVNGYPGPDVFARFVAALPVLGAVASFALGIAAIVAGLALLVPALLRLWRRRQPPPLAFPAARSPYVDRGPSSARQVPVRVEENYDPQADAFDDFPPGTGSGYGGAYSGDGGHGGRPSGNGQYEQRRQFSMYR